MEETDLQPPNQENQDPGHPDSLRSMFFEGMNKIGTQRTENLFQSLDKRTLTEDEQSIIDDRVAHQRKMFELFERREKTRKIQELMEVCPDLSEDEAGRALDMCNGKEEDAATALVSDSNFLRRVKIACGTAPEPISRQGSGKQSWAARPSSTRPRLIDPATLGDTVFVGAFRGKGFQNNTGKPTARLAKTSTAARTTRASEAGEQEVEEQEQQEEEDVEMEDATAAAADIGQEEKEMEAPVPAVEPATATADKKKRRGAKASTPPPPEHAAAGVGQNHAPTPPTVPKNYALMKETSEGTVRPVTDSELKRAVHAVTGPEAEIVPEAGGSQQPPVSQSRPRRNAGRERKAAVSEEVLESMMLKLAGLEDTKAVAWLVKMAAPTAAAVLEMLGSEQPERAVDLSEKLDAAAAAAAAAVAEPSPAAKMASPAPAGGTISADAHPEQSVSQKNKSHDKKMKSASPSSGETTEEEDFAAAPRSTRATRRTSVSGVATAHSGRPEGEKEEAPTPRSTRSTRQRTAGLASPAAPASEGTSKRSQGNKAEKQQPAKRRKSLSAQAEGGAAAAETVEEEAPAAATATAVTATRTAAANGARSAAISSRGHTNRGRVKQKSHKSADLVAAGTLRAHKGWYNAGYIFPEGFHSRTLFRSSVAIDSLCVHECFIEGREGKYWPAPTYKVVALDRPNEPLIAKSCTGCWTGVLKRINAEIEARRRAGEDLPPPPKTAIAGPEYFGFNQPNIVEAVEALDPEHLCAEYWAGKEDRQAAASGLFVPAPAPPRAPRATTGGGGGSRAGTRRAGAGGRRRRGGAGSDSDGEDGGRSGEEHDESHYTTNRWSAINRQERYRKRLQVNGEDDAAAEVDPENPLPDLIDPITLEPVVRPAMSPWGHVMGLATWKAVLAESGVCPFTKNPMKWEQCRVLTHHNIEAYKDQIID